MDSSSTHQVTFLAVTSLLLKDNKGSNNFHIHKNPPKVKMLSGEESPELNADEAIDLRGRICPMTFVYTKLALEKMQPGQVLKVTLDYPPAYKNVPQSVTAQGLGVVIAKRKEDNARCIWIKKTGT